MKNPGRKQLMPKVRRIVIKIGSSVLADKKGGLKAKTFHHLAGVFVDLIQRRRLEVVLVSSGAIACGMKKLKFSKKPTAIPVLQACAAAGQTGLVEAYERAFAPHKMHTAQILLTRDDLQNRQRSLNAKHAMGELLSRGAVPIVNENDTVAVDEIKVGDNDTLAAYVACMIEADLLVLLTNCDGLHTADPDHDASAQRVSLVKEIDAKTMAMAKGTSAETRHGGMITKVEAARIAGKIPTVIANALQPDVLERIMAGDDVGTLFLL